MDFYEHFLVVTYFLSTKKLLSPNKMSPLNYMNTKFFMVFPLFFNLNFDSHDIMYKISNKTNECLTSQNM